ncbi:MAG: LysM peptidoglycan-binding domain-containing protein, partial [Eubacterium sp.]|nr:LysM peptidoglycan-binding domain-containing protein [Eubacterium sp.]
MTRTNIISIIIVAAVLISAALFSGKIIMANSSPDLSANTVKCYTTVEVKKGDTLTSIANKYISSEYSSVDEYIDEVISLNHLKSTKILAGEYIA